MNPRRDLLPPVPPLRTESRQEYLNRCRRERRCAAAFLLAFLLLGLLVFLTSCTIHPTVYKDAKGRDVVSLGGSLMTKSKTDGARIIMADGSVLEYYRTGADETAIPRYYVQAQAATAIAGIGASVTKNAANNETTRVLSGDAVKTTGITTAAEVEKARLAAQAAP